MAGVSEEALKKRTMQFALRAIRLAESLPETRASQIIANQLIRSATSVAANYRAACRARSPKDFVNKIGLVVEEVDESAHWIELIVEAELMSKQRVADLWKEANELTAIFNASHKIANQNLRYANRKSKIESRK